MKKLAPFVRNPYNYDLEQASDEAAFVPSGESMTVQSMSEDADLNVLMKRYGITGKFPENPRIPQYGDFTHVTDFRGAIEAARDAMDKFMEFPAELRQRFDNNPQFMLDYMQAGGSAEGLKELFENPKASLPPEVKVTDRGGAAGAESSVSISGVPIPK
jgi:hypothetical protein